ncbi:MAG: class I SAM-dependent methyltransferase [Sphingomonas bacterium]
MSDGPDARSPKASPFDRDTINFYESNAASYSAARPDEVTPELVTFLPNLMPGSRILELGCGSGRDAAEMERWGFEIDATDGTPAMAALASERLGRTVRVLRFDDLDAQESYDAVVACASLLHVPRMVLPAILTRVWKALKPGGWHFASYKTAAAEGRDEHQRYYNYLDRQDAERIYGETGTWASIRCDEYDGVGYFSASARWLTVTAQK